MSGAIVRIMNARQRAEFESMLIAEAVRRLRRQLPRDVSRWARVSQMSRLERGAIALISWPYRLRDWLRRKMRP
jgi:hypothetical protein